MKKQLTALLIIMSSICLYAGNVKSVSEIVQTDIDSILKKIEIIPVMINGDKNNRINIVIMNRWSSKETEPYNSPAMREEFLKDIDESLIAALTPGDERAQTTYANYREFFNVYGLWWPDMPEWGKGVDLKIVYEIRDRLFLPWDDENTGWVTYPVIISSVL